MVKVRGKKGGRGESTSPPLNRTFPSKDKGKIQKLQKTKGKGGSNKKGLSLPSDSFLKTSMEKLNLGYYEDENDSRKAAYRSAYLLVHAISYAWKPLTWEDNTNGPLHLSRVTFKNWTYRLKHSAGENSLMARQRACYDLIKYLSGSLNFIDRSLYVRCLFEHRHYGALGCIIANMFKSFKKGYGSEMKPKKGDKKKLDVSTKQARDIYTHTKKECEKRIIKLLNNKKIKSEQLILEEGDESDDILIRIKKEVDKTRDEYLGTNDVIVVDPSACKKRTKVKFISSDEESEEEVKRKRNEMKKIPIDIKKVKKEKISDNECEMNNSSFTLLKEVKREKIDEDEKKKKKIKKENVEDGKKSIVNEENDKIDKNKIKKEKQAEAKLKEMEEKMAKLYEDGFFETNCKAFGLKNTMTKGDLSKAAIMVYKHVNELLNDQLPEIAFIESSKDRESWSEENKLTAYSGLLRLNKKKFFPTGMLFLLLQCRNEQTIKNVCIELKIVLDVFFELVEAENNCATKQASPFNTFTFILKLTDVRDRMKQLHARLHQVYKHHFGYLIKTVPTYIVHAATNLEKEPIVKKVDKNVSKLSICSSPFDESEWSFIRSFGVTTVWNRSDELIEWEEKHQSEIDRLSQKIDDHAAATVTREDDYQEKLGAFNIIKDCLNEVMNDTDTLHMVGSSLSNFAPHNSNLDVLVCGQNKSTFSDIAECLLKSDKISSDGIHPAKFYIKKDKSTIICHIHYKLNTLYMAHVYCVMDQLDERIASLALLLKAWRILDHKSNHLGSYHIITLLIHYLQCGVSPPVLPSLNFLYPRLDPKSFQSYDTHLPSDNAPKTENIQSVASLLIGFFIYFSNFKFEKYIISIREGHVLKRLNPSEDNNKLSLCESPYDQVLRQMKTLPSYSHIRSAMKDAANDLITSFKLSTIKTL